MSRDWGLWELANSDWDNHISSKSGQPTPSFADLHPTTQQPPPEKDSSPSQPTVEEQNQTALTPPSEDQETATEADISPENSVQEKETPNPLETETSSPDPWTVEDPVQETENTEPLNPENSIPEPLTVEDPVQETENTEPLNPENSIPEPLTVEDPVQETENTEPLNPENSIPEPVTPEISVNETENTEPLNPETDPTIPEENTVNYPATTEKTTTRPLFKIQEMTITESDLFPLLQKHQLLPKLIQEIIIDRALQDVECSKETLQTAIANFFVSQNLTTEQQIQLWLQRQGMTLGDIEQLITRRVKIETFKEQKWGESAETEFHNRKDQLDQVTYSLIRTQDAGMSQELYFRLLEGEGNFAELARNYSKGPEAKTGGAIGPVSMSNIHPKLREMFHRSKPGQLWAPSYIDNWFVIVRLDQFTPAEFDKKVRQQILNDCFNQWLQEERQKVVMC